MRVLKRYSWSFTARRKTISPNILTYELTSRRRSFLYFSLGVIIYGLLITGLYDSIFKIKGFAQYWDQFPSNLKNLFGGGNINILTPEGFLTVEYYQLTLLIILAAFVLGFTAFCIVKARENGSLEMILAHPIERWKYSFTSSVSLASALAVLVIITVGTLMIGSAIFGLHIGLLGQLKIMVVLWFLLLALGSISLLGSAAFNSPGQVYALGITVLIVCYLVHYLGNTWTIFRWIDHALLLHYYNPYSVMTEGGFPWWSLLYYGLVSIAFGWFAILVLERRDITT